MEEVFRRQQLVAKCRAHEDKQCLTGPVFRDCQSHDARRQPHHVELPQFHALEVIAGGTRGVKFALNFFQVEQSNDVQSLQTRLFAITLGHWQQTS